MKAGTEFSWLSLARKVEVFFFYLLIFFLPTQLGKHFWLDFSYVFGQRVDYLSPTLYATDILLICLFILTVIQRKIPIHPVYALCMLFFALSAFFAAQPLIGWYMFLKFLEISFFAWYVSHTTLSKVFIGACFVIGVTFESLLALLQFFHQGSIGGFFYFLGERTFTASTPGIANASIQGELILRPYATFSHPNMLAGYLVVGMLISIALLLSAGRRVRVFLFAALIIGTIGLVFSLSRTGIVSWIISGILAIVVTLHRRVSKLILFTILSIAAAWLLLIMFYPILVFRLLPFSLGESLTERVILAKAAVDMTFAHPLFGVGPGSFITSLSFVSNAIVLQPVHNIYLLISSEFGLVGCAIFVSFLFYLLQKLVIVWRSNKAEEDIKILFIGLALFSVLFSGFFDHYFLTLQQGQLLFAFLIGILYAEARQSATIQE